MMHFSNNSLKLFSLQSLHILSKIDFEKKGFHIFNYEKIFSLRKTIAKENLIKRIRNIHSFLIHLMDYFCCFSVLKKLFLYTSGGIIYLH